MNFRLFYCQKVKEKNTEQKGLQLSSMKGGKKMQRSLSPEVPKLVQFPRRVTWIHPSFTESIITASEHAVLPVEGDVLTLQCNLTSVHGVHQESFWMKNGEEIPETRTSNRNTEHRSVHVRAWARRLTDASSPLQTRQTQRRQRWSLRVRVHLPGCSSRQRLHRSPM